MPEAAVIRRAGRGEIATILDLTADLGRPPPEPGDRGQSGVAAELLERPDIAVLMAERRGKAAGLACVLILPRLGHSTPEARLLDLIVRREERSSGLGRGLVEAALDLASQAGCRILRLECGHQRTAAHRFYRALGFENMGREWQRRIP